MCLSAGAIDANAQKIKSVKVTELRHRIDTSNSVMVVNFWATFCIPCIHEIPFFEKISAKYKSQGVKLLLVSLDLKSHFPAKVEAFAKKQKFKSENVWLNETNADYFCTMIDPSWSGSIPSTYFVNNKTGYKKLFEGEMTAGEFERELKLAIAKTP